MSNIVRTKRDGCWQVRSNHWGAFLQPVDDPLATASLEKGALEHFELNEGITPIPADLWSRWIKLCFHFVSTVRSEVEVSCRLLQSEDDRSQWRILVPQQDVDGASVRVESFDQSIDIATGEIIPSYPPPGWIPCGSSHSHNTMTAFFSSTDDHYELGDPGLHIVVGSVNTAQRTYVPVASITANRRRFLIDSAAVIDLTPAQEHSFHPDVLKLINHERPRRTSSLSNKDWQRVNERLFGHPNAGNGYHTSENDLLFDSGTTADDSGWPFSRNQFSEPLSIWTPEGENVFCRGLEDTIEELMQTGQTAAAHELLYELSLHIEHIKVHILSTDDDTHTQDSANASHSAASTQVPAGEW